MPKPKLLIATTNRGKQREYRALLQELEAELVFPGDLGIRREVAEDGTTYRENAARKARAFARASGLPALADDSGLEVDALGGRPGVHSSRWAGEGADDAQRRAFLLRELRGRPAPWKARFVCVIAAAAQEGDVCFAEGECRGEVIACERGGHGFGYDPLFLVEGAARTMAELAPEEKNRVSHRARAARAAIPFLHNLLKLK